MQQLPERVRPRSLAQVVGQEPLLGPQGTLTQLVTVGALPSLLLWGPPGCGKTTLARLLATEVGLAFAPFSAVLGGLPELRQVLQEAKARQALGQATLLFIDEIHRFNKAQQDALLPHVEGGTVVLVGATTENPGFSCNPALVSRCRVLRLQGLDSAALGRLLDQAAAHPDGLKDFRISAEARAALIDIAGGDGRRLLLAAEQAHAVAQGQEIRVQHVAQVLQDSRPSHDKHGDHHYDVASAFIKSMRASDVQAALYYLARQLEAGEDPRFVARRILIFASEDVGLADPQAMVQASSAFHAVERLGMPEAIYPLSQAVIYCSTAPKSNSTKAYFAAAQRCRDQPGLTPPLFLRNAPNALMREAGYGQGYVYDHDTPEHYAGQACLPEAIRGDVYYRPGPFGFEKDIAKRLEWWEARRKQN